MNRKTLLVLTGLLLWVGAAQAQSGIYIGSGTQLFITANNELSIDSLVLKPSANYTLTGTNALQRNAAVKNALSSLYIKRVYKWTGNLTGFSGTIGFYYRDADLNGITEADLVPYLYGTNWKAFTTGLTKDATKNYIGISGLSAVSFSELTLAKYTAPKSTTSIVPNQSGAANMHVQPLFTFYPNPVRSQVSINSGKAMQQVLLFDAGGSLVQKASPGGALQYGMNLQQLPAGHYTLRVSMTDNTTVTATLIKL